MEEDARDAAVKGEDSSVLSRRIAREVNSLWVFFEEISGFILRKFFVQVGWSKIGFLWRQSDSLEGRNRSRKEFKRAHFFAAEKGSKGHTFF